MRRSCVVPILLALVACRSPEGADTVDTGDPTTSGELLVDLTLSAGDLSPEVQETQPHYGVRASTLAASTTVTATSGCAGASITLEHETVSGGPLASGANRSAFDLSAGERVSVHVSCGGATGTWDVTALPDDLPIIGVETPGEPAPGYFFLANFDFFEQPADIGRYRLIVDNAGVAVWFERDDAPSFDFRVASDGHLTLVGNDDQGRMAAHVRGVDFAWEERWLPEMADDGRSVGLDVHEFQRLEGGETLVLGLAPRTVDLTPWGGPAAVGTSDHIVQIFGADGTKVFEWSSEGVFDFAELPPGHVRNAPQIGWEYAHVNSVFLDPDTGDLVISAPIPDEVLYVSRTSGEVVWRMGGRHGGMEFVDDARDGGWEGFAGQHCAVPLGGGRVLLFDNAVDTAAPTGDARAVEYQVDSVAGTATRVAEFSLAGAGTTTAAGSVQRLPGGHTVVGWGARPRGDNSPALTEFDADGAPVLHLTLEANQWTYRAFKHEWRSDR